MVLRCNTCDAVAYQLRDDAADGDVLSDAIVWPDDARPGDLIACRHCGSYDVSSVPTAA